MDASLLFDGSVLGTAMTVMESGTDLGNRCLTSWSGVALILKSRPGGAAAPSQVGEDFARAQIPRDGHATLTDLQTTGDGLTAKPLDDGKQASLIVSSIGGVPKQ